MPQSTDSTQSYGLCFLVRVRLNALAKQTGQTIYQQTIYQLKHGLPNDYLCQQLKKPSLKMAFA